jgi:NitT/TauT family transport system substrate-binding protein
MAQSAKTKLKIGYVPFVDVAQLYVMDGEGWVGQAGLEFELTRFASPFAVMQALESDRFDAFYVAFSAMLGARAAGAGLKVVAVCGTDSVSLVGSGALADLFEEKASPAEAFAAFHHRSGHPARLLAMPKGALPGTVLRYYLKTNDVADRDVEIISGVPDGVLRHYLGLEAQTDYDPSRVFDGGAVVEPVAAIIERRDPSIGLLASGRDMMPEHPGFALAVRETLIRDNPDAVSALVRLHLRAAALIAFDQGVAARHCTKYLWGGLSEKDVAPALRGPSAPTLADPRMIHDAAEIMQAFQVEIGAQMAPVPFDAMIDPSFFLAVKGQNL